MIPVDINSVRNAFDTAIQNEGVECTFVLKDGTQLLPIKGVLRFQREDPLTGGLQQDQRKISIMAHRWDAVAPLNRPPLKGDQVEVLGQRHAIEEADPAMIQGIVLGWRIRLKG